MGYTGSQSVYWSGLSEKDQYKTSVIAVNFDGIRSLNPTVLMGLNAWQSEIIHIPLFSAEKAILHFNKTQAEKRKEQYCRISHRSKLLYRRDALV